MHRPTTPFPPEPRTPVAYVPSTGLGAMVVVRLAGGGDPPRGRRAAATLAATEREER